MGGGKSDLSLSELHEGLLHQWSQPIAESGNEARFHRPAVPASVSCFCLLLCHRFKAQIFVLSCQPRSLYRLLSLIQLSPSMCLQLHLHGTLRAEKQHLIHMTPCARVHATVAFVDYDTFTKLKKKWVKTLSHAPAQPGAGWALAFAAFTLITD